jgi:hypothetical protein
MLCNSLWLVGRPELPCVGAQLRDLDVGLGNRGLANVPLDSTQQTLEALSGVTLTVTPGDLQFGPDLFRLGLESLEAS